MPNSTTNYGLLQPLVNNATDSDLWGGYLNTTIGNVDTLFATAIQWQIQLLTTTTTLTAPTAGSTTTGASRILYECNAGSAFPINLPAASTCKWMTVAFKKIDSSANAVTITPNGSDKIDGAASFSLNGQYSYLIIVSDGSASWNIISQTPPSVQSASTTVAGILKTATAAIAAGGVDAATALTSAAFAGNSVLSGNGAYKFPGGFLIQWGSFNTGGASGSVSFPVAFPNAVFQVVATCQSGSPINIVAIDTASPPTTTGFTARTWAFSTGAAATINWIAVGY